MMMYGVRVLGEKRKLWRAAEILTDVWNQDQYSRAVAAAAVDKHNRHMEECNRVVEAQLSGRPSPAALETSDTKEHLEKLRAGRDTLDSDNKRLNAELQKKEKLITEMSARLDVLERRSERASGGTVPLDGSDTVPKLVARVNELQQQLDAERLKNRQFKGA